jgi:hypothetical protein
MAHKKILTYYEVNFIGASEYLTRLEKKKTDVMLNSCTSLCLKRVFEDNKAMFTKYHITLLKCRFACQLCSYHFE